MKATIELGEDLSWKAKFIILGHMVYSHALSTEKRNFVDEAQEKKIINLFHTYDTIKPAL